MSLTGTYSRVQVGKNVSDKCPIKNGLKQGDALTPLLFNFALGLARTSGFFAAAVKQPQRPIISWLCARTAKETHVLLTIWRSQCVRYTSTRHLLCHNMFYDHTLAEIWMLPDVYIITD